MPPFGDAQAELLIVGLAPGLRGANRTGRPFTGDYAGGLLYATLRKFGFAEGDYDARPDDGLSSGACASPMLCAACRRKTSPNRARSRTAGGFSPPRSALCPDSARSWHSARSRITRCSPRSACAAHYSLSRTADCMACLAACCSPTAIIARGSTPIRASSAPQCSKRCSPLLSSCLDAPQGAGGSAGAAVDLAIRS